ncbi:MAG: hypothetical protein V1816_27940 [Pseudomonadota bacterium]
MASTSSSASLKKIWNSSSFTKPPYADENEMLTPALDRKNNGRVFFGAA